MQIACTYVLARSNFTTSIFALKIHLLKVTYHQVNSFPPNGELKGDVWLVNQSKVQTWVTCFANPKVQQQCNSFNWLILMYSIFCPSKQTKWTKEFFLSTLYWKATFHSIVICWIKNATELYNYQITLLYVNLNEIQTLNAVHNNT